MTGARRSGPGFRTAGMALVGAALLGAVVWLFPKVGLGHLSNPESEIITQLKQTERDGLVLPLGPGMPSLISAQHHFDRIVVALDAPDRAARAVSTLDLDGKVAQTQVSSLGLEKIAFRYVNGAWAPVDTDAPLLRDALALLERRRAALEAGLPEAREALEALVTPEGRERALGDPQLVQWLGVTHRRYQAVAWYLRTEREQVVVTEEYRMQGDLPDRPVDVEGRRRLTLVRVDGRLLFDGGLM